LANFGGTPGNQFGVVSARQANIYLNCPGHDDSCWGDSKGSITTFQANLAKSNFISIVDQYVGVRGRGRYPLGAQFFSDQTLPNAPWGTPTLLDSDAQALAFAAANSTSSFGYGFIYHVFVPQGTDVCFDNSFSMCYSPDHTDTFSFCGYHASFDSGGKHILYSVEPFDPVPGCSVSPQSATDAQVTTLSHEIFETITDPDPPFQWFNQVLGLLGVGEIGDEYSVVVGLSQFDNPEIFLVSLGSQKYNIQLEYSNKRFGCSAIP
jgi:hypothetical protein